MTEGERSSALSNLKVDVSALLTDFDMAEEEESGGNYSTFVRCRTFTGCSRDRDGLETFLVDTTMSKQTSTHEDSPSNGLLSPELNRPRLVVDVSAFMQLKPVPQERAIVESAPNTFVSR